MNPTPGILEVFAAVLRKLDPAELATLRERFVQLQEDPAEIALIDAEIERRKT